MLACGAWRWTGEARLGASPASRLWGPAGALEGFPQRISNLRVLPQGLAQHSPSRTGKPSGRDAREADQHFLTQTYPPRNRAGAATVAQYENLLRFFIPPPGSEAGSTERSSRGPCRHRAPVSHLQRVKLRWRVRRNGPKKGRDPEGPRPGWYSYGRRAGRRWGGSTPKAAATFLADLLRTGAPRSAFPAVFFETPASVARSRLVIPRSLQGLHSLG